MSQQLNKEQTEAVKSALEGGAKLADIQKLLLEKFGISMTYMEARFLIDDLDLAFKEEQPEPAVLQDPKEPEVKDGNPPDGVRVELDPVQRPGAVAGGKVVFSDGVSATWELDMEGRLRLGGTPEGYRPSPADVSDFQQQLRMQLGG